VEKKNDFKVVKEYNYTISIYDTKGRSINFRDITGRDLEFLEHILEDKKSLPIKDLILILDKLNTTDKKVSNLTKKDFTKVFKLVNENILCNFLPKFEWLELCFLLQGKSFTFIKDFEDQPMTKFMAMVEIYKKRDKVASPNASEVFEE
jgi:hypothetical protein